MGPFVRSTMWFAVGAALAGAGLWLGHDAGAASAPTVVPAAATTSPPVTEAPWIDRGVRFESTVIVPFDFVVGDGTADLDYELIGLGSGLGSLPHVLPEVWELRTDTGTTRRALTGPPQAGDFDAEPEPISGSVQFTDLPGDLELDDVVDVRILGWRVAAPVRSVIELAPEVGSTARVYDGATIVLENILEQSTGSILGFAVDAVPDPWRVDERFPFGSSTTFQGEGPGWVSASSTIGGTGLTGGATGFQLRWKEREVPDPVLIRYSTVAWTQFAAEVSIAAEVGLG